MRNVVIILAAVAALCLPTKRELPPPAFVVPLIEGAGPGAPVEGTKTSPDGATEVACDLPESLREHNVGGRDGAGLCVFTSIEYAAKYQGVAKAMDLQAKMRKEPGGGYPEKVDTELRKFGMDDPYLQDTSGDPALLRAILDSGRLACVTYDGHDTHYGNQSIAHMVCLPCFTDKWAAVYDNNFTADSQLEWMSPDEFVKRWKGNGGGWVFVWLNSPPPPPPHN